VFRTVSGRYWAQCKSLQKRLVTGRLTVSLDALRKEILPMLVLSCKQPRPVLAARLVSFACGFFKAYHDQGFLVYRATTHSPPYSRVVVLQQS
jgi:hypothetical protein